MKLEELFTIAKCIYDNKKEQVDYLVDFAQCNFLVYKGIYLIDQHIRKAFKINELRSCKRFRTIDVDEACNTNLGIDKTAIWIKLHESARRAYFAVIDSEGKYYRARIEKKTKEVTMGEAKRYGTTKMDYNKSTFSYSKYLLDLDTDIGIPSHILVCVANGLYDEMALEDIAISAVNHKNRNHFDNRLENLEVCTAQENVDHKIVTNRLSELGLFNSMTAKNCSIFRKLPSNKQMEYILKLEKLYNNGQDNINDIVMEKILQEWQDNYSSSPQKYKILREVVA